jgi:dynein heavy chain
LGGEKVRWKELADQLAQDQEKLIGDVLLSSGIIAYLGGFTALFRKDITN